MYFEEWLYQSPDNYIRLIFLCSILIWNLYLLFMKIVCHIIYNLTLKIYYKIKNGGKEKCKN